MCAFALNTVITVLQWGRIGEGKVELNRSAV